MKKATYPHLGNLYLALETLVEAMGIEPLSPPLTNKKTLELGSLYVAEEACLPLKITLGNLLEGASLGADFAIMGGGVGPCRFGYYGEVQKEISRELGSSLDYVIFEPNLEDILKKLKYLTGTYSLKKLLGGLLLTLKKIEALDDFDKNLLQIRPRLKDYGRGMALERKFHRQIRDARSFRAVNLYSKESLEELNHLEKKDDNLDLNIALIGEFYMILESYANSNLEQMINRLGVGVKRNVSLSNWIKTTMLGLNKNKKIIQLAKPYISTFVGGHGRETVGEAIYYMQKGLDGLIHLAPLTCMPEIIAESILLNWSEKNNIPILFLFLDEHSGEIGMQTRLEAFLDMLHFRKERKKYCGQERICWR